MLRLSGCLFVCLCLHSLSFSLPPFSLLPFPLPALPLPPSTLSSSTTSNSVSSSPPFRLRPLPPLSPPNPNKLPPLLPAAHPPPHNPGVPNLHNPHHLPHGPHKKHGRPSPSRLDRAVPTTPRHASQQASRGRSLHANGPSHSPRRLAQFSERSLEFCVCWLRVLGVVLVWAVQGFFLLLIWGWGSNRWDGKGFGEKGFAESIVVLESIAGSVDDCHQQVHGLQT